MIAMMKPLAQSPKSERNREDILRILGLSTEAPTLPPGFTQDLSSPGSLSLGGVQHHIPSGKIFGAKVTAISEQKGHARPFTPFKPK